MKKNPLIVFIGLAVAAVAAIMAVTKDRWMGAPQPAAALQQTGGGETTATKTETGSGNTTTTVAEAPAASTDTSATQPAAATSADATATQPAAATTTTAEATSTEAAPAATTTTTTAATTTTETASSTVAVAATEAPKADVQPSFDTVRVEKTGEAVVAGRAEAGSEVTLMLDGQSIGSATTNADGAFVVVPDQPLPAGSGSLTIESKAANETAAVKSNETVAVIVPADDKQTALVAVMSPDAPTKVLQKPTAETQVAQVTPVTEAVPAAQAVSLDAVDYDDKGNIVFNGRAAAGTTARLYIDNTLAGDAKAGEDGRWTFTGAAAMTTGPHTLRVDSLDSEGKVTSRVELPFVREEQQKVAAAATTTQTQTQTQTTTETSGAASPDKPKDGRIVIQPGNNLWRISNVIYGSGAKYSVIYEANKDQIRDPDRIYPGQVFMTPDVVPPEKIDPKRRDPLKPEETGASAQ